MESTRHRTYACGRQMGKKGFCQALIDARQVIILLYLPAWDVEAFNDKKKGCRVVPASRLRYAIEFIYQVIRGKGRGQSFTLNSSLRANKVSGLKSNFWCCRKWGRRRDKQNWTKAFRARGKSLKWKEVSPPPTPFPILTAVEISRHTSGRRFTRSRLESHAFLLKKQHLPCLWHVRSGTNVFPPEKSLPSDANWNNTTGGQGTTQSLMTNV